MSGGKSTGEMTNVAHLSPVFSVCYIDVISLSFSLFSEKKAKRVCMWLVCVEMLYVTY